MLVNQDISWLLHAAACGITQDMTLPDRIRERLEALNTSADAVSKAVGTNPNLVGDILRGKVKSPRFSTIEKLARELKVSADWLATGQDAANAFKIKRIPVVGVIEAGAFRQVDGMANEVEPRYLPGIAAGDTNDNSFALEVRGPSINKFCAEGGFVVCVPAYSYLPAGANPDHLLDGKFVAVERILPDGLREVTVKQYAAIEGQPAELRPYSTHPAHQAAITIDDDPDCEVRVFGVVRYKIETAP